MPRPSRSGGLLRASVRLAAAVVVCVLFVSPAATQEAAHVDSEPLTLAALEDLRVPSEVRVSPDGTVVLFRLLVPQSEGIGWRGEIWTVGHDTDEPARLLEGGRIRWAPDGDRFAYLARGNTGRQLWLARPDGSGTRRLTGVPGGVRDYAWSPSGDRIAYVATVNGIDQLFLQVIADSVARQVTDLAESVHVDFFGGGAGFDWSPDGSRIAFATQTGRSFEDAYRTDISVLDLSTGSVRPVVERPGMDYRPRWSPDGSRIAFVTSFGVEDRLASHGIALVGAGGGIVHHVGRAVDAAFLDVPGDLVWSADGTEVFFHGAVGVERRLQALDVNDGTVRTLTTNGGVVARTSFSSDRRAAAFLGSTAERPYDVYRVDLAEGPAPETVSESRRLTRLNPVLEDLDAGRVETIRWRDEEGRSLEGLLVSPRAEGAASGSLPPVIVWMHGGPEGHAVRAFDPALPSIPFRCGSWRPAATPFSCRTSVAARATERNFGARQSGVPRDGRPQTSSRASMRWPIRGGSIRGGPAWSDGPRAPSRSPTSWCDPIGFGRRPSEPATASCTRPSARAMRSSSGEVFTEASRGRCPSDTERSRRSCTRRESKLRAC